MPEIDFFVPGVPATQGSKRVKPWRTDVRAAAMEKYQGPLAQEAVSVRMYFYLPRPKCHFGTGKNANVLKASAPQTHTQTPDVVKLARAVEDALKGVVWRDDSQVTSELIQKNWTTDRPGVSVHILFEA